MMNKGTAIDIRGPTHKKEWRGSCGKDELGSTEEMGEEDEVKHDPDCTGEVAEVAR